MKQYNTKIPKKANTVYFCQTCSNSVPNSLVLSKMVAHAVQNLA